MCIIIDANRCHRMHSPGDETFAPIYDWIKGRDGKLVYGGKLARELQLNEKTKRLLRQWTMAGKALSFPDEDLKPEETRLIDGGLLRSDDPHCLALAIVSGARTIWTEDRNLRSDFTNPSVISSPRGKVYALPRHSHLLRHTQGCPGYISKGKKRSAAKAKRTKKTG